MRSCWRFRQLTRGGSPISGAAAAARHHQRNAGRGHDGARSTPVPASIDASVVAYQWDAQRDLLFRDADAGRVRRRAVRADDQFTAPDHAAEAAAIRPRIIHVETVRPGDTVQSLASQMAYRDFKLERFLSLNGLARQQRAGAGPEGQIGGLRDATEHDHRASLSGM